MYNKLEKYSYKIFNAKNQKDLEFYAKKLEYYHKMQMNNTQYGGDLITRINKKYEEVNKTIETKKNSIDIEVDANKQQIEAFEKKISEIPGKLNAVNTISPEFAEGIVDFIHGISENIKNITENIKKIDDAKVSRDIVLPNLDKVDNVISKLNEEIQRFNTIKGALYKYILTSINDVNADNYIKVLKVWIEDENDKAEFINIYNLLKKDGLILSDAIKTKINEILTPPYALTGGNIKNIINNMHAPLIQKAEQTKTSLETPRDDNIEKEINESIEAIISKITEINYTNEDFGKTYYDITDASIKGIESVNTKLDEFTVSRGVVNQSVFDEINTNLERIKTELSKTELSKDDRVKESIISYLNSLNYAEDGNVNKFEEVVLRYQDDKDFIKKLKEISETKSISGTKLIIKLNNNSAQKILDPKTYGSKSKPPKKKIILL